MRKCLSFAFRKCDRRGGQHDHCFVLTGIAGRLLQLCSYFTSTRVDQIALMFRSLVSRETLPALWPVLAAGLSERQRLSSNATTTAAASLPDTPSLADFAPFSPIRVMRPNQNLEIAFDVRTRNPLYVLERLVVVDDNKPAAKNKSKRPNFYQDSQNLPAVYRSQNQHYHNSGSAAGAK